MDNKGRNIFMACAGGYLIYTGYNLVVDVLSREPENKTMFLIAGGAFVIIGLLTVFMNLKEYFKDFKKDVFETEPVTEEVEDTEAIEEVEVEKKGHVEIVNLSYAEDNDADDIEDETDEDAEEEILESEEAEDLEE